MKCVIKRVVIPRNKNDKNPLLNLELNLHFFPLFKKIRILINKIQFI